MIRMMEKIINFIMTSRKASSFFMKAFMKFLAVVLKYLPLLDLVSLNLYSSQRINPIISKLIFL